MKINYNALTQPERESAFFSFVNAAMVSREDLSNPLDLDKLEVKLQINDQNVDFIRAWGLYTEFSAQPTPTATATPTNNLDTIRSQLERLESRLEYVMSDARGSVAQYDDRVGYALSEALDSALDSLKESIMDSFRSEQPDYTDVTNDMESEISSLREDVLTLLSSLNNEQS